MAFTLRVQHDLDALLAQGNKEKQKKINHEEMICGALVLFTEAPEAFRSFKFPHDCLPSGRPELGKRPSVLIPTGV